MDKAGKKTRDIKFHSKKNNAIVCIHSAFAKEFAKYLEGLPYIESYEACYALDRERFAGIDSVDIRNTYFQTEWTSDFFIRFSDGRTGVRELTTMSELQKKATIEKLELSRRYWELFDISEWKVVVKEDP